MQKEAAQRRCVILCLVLVAGLSGLSGRLVYLQVINRKTYTDQAEDSYRRKSKTLARRGYIEDRNGEVLAKDIPHKTIIIDKYPLKDPRVAARSLACKYIRDAIERDDKKIEVEHLQGLMTDSVKSVNRWDQLDEEKRDALVMRGATLLLEDFGAQKIINRNFDMLVEELARPLGIKKEELKQKLDLKNPRMDVVLKKDVPASKAIKNLENMLKRNWILGFRFEDSVKRVYSSPESAPHVIGYTNQYNKGAIGVEKFHDKYLSGSDGSETKKRDPRGLLLPDKGSVNPPKHGWNIQLTLDMGIQGILEEELEAAIAYYKCQKGTIIVMDPHTGEVLGMASRPHFNLNIRDQRLVDNGTSFAYQDLYEPGSTFKVVAVAAALEEKKTHINEEIFCHNGHWKKGSNWVKDYASFGYLTPGGILKKSSNIGAWMLARRMPRQTFFNYVSDFGFGQRTGIGASAEGYGKVINTKKEIDDARVSYGYCVNVTPLQIISAYNVIANGGRYLRPQLIKKITYADGQTLAYESEKEELRKVISSETAESVRVMLATVTEKGGTAWRAAIEGYTVGGKTGTAWKVDPKLKGYNKDKYSVSFVGMVPAENPNFVCVVVLDEPMLKVHPETGKEFKRGGGSVAAPVFAKVAKRVIKRRNVAPNVPVEEKAIEGLELTSNE